MRLLIFDCPFNENLAEKNSLSLFLFYFITLSISGLSMLLVGLAVKAEFRKVVVQMKKEKNMKLNDVVFFVSIPIEAF